MPGFVHSRNSASAKLMRTACSIPQAAGRCGSAVLSAGAVHFRLATLPLCAPPNQALGGVQKAQPCPSQEQFQAARSRYMRATDLTEQKSEKGFSEVPRDSLEVGVKWALVRHRQGVSGRLRKKPAQQAWKRSRAAGLVRRFCPLPAGVLSLRLAAWHSPASCSQGQA